MFILTLNDMRHPHFEDLTPVACAETTDALIAFVQRERVESYVDQGEHHIVHDTDVSAQMIGPWVEPKPGYAWSKCFKRGGPLEWYNDPGDSGLSGGDYVHQVLSREEFLAQAVLAAGQQWDAKIGSLPRV